MAAFSADGERTLWTFSAAWRGSITVLINIRAESTEALAEFIVADLLRIEDQRYTFSHPTYRRESLGDFAIRIEVRQPARSLITMDIGIRDNLNGICIRVEYFAWNGMTRVADELLVRVNQTVRDLCKEFGIDDQRVERSEQPPARIR